MSLKVIESGSIRYIVYDFLLVFYSNVVPKFLRYSTCMRYTYRYVPTLATIQWPWNPGYLSLRIIETDMHRSTTYD